MLTILVGVTGFEPAASTSQMSRATNCATPRNIRYCLSIKNQLYYYTINQAADKAVRRLRRAFAVRQKDLMVKCSQPLRSN